VNPLWTRRRLVQTAIASGAGLSLARLAFPQGGAVSATPPLECTIELHNTHTSETVSVVYRRGAEYITRAIDSLRNVMRDHRNGAVHDIDVGLYDQLFDLAHAAGQDARFQVISGYRSAESNAAMASRPGSGVARRSLHIDGRAIDVRLHGCSCSGLRDLALTAARGGVGYYRRSDFVHLDTGRFRTWNG